MVRSNEFIWGVIVYIHLDVKIFGLEFRNKNLNM